MNDHEMRDLFAPIPEIDLNMGFQYYLYNMDNYASALLATLKSIKSKIPILKIMVETNEYEGLRMITQTLRRMLTTIGVESVAELSYRLEISFLNEDTDFHDILIEFLCTLEDLASRMEEVIKKLESYNIKMSKENKNSYFDYDFTRTKESIRITSGYIEKKIV